MRTIFGAAACTLGLALVAAGCSDGGSVADSKTSFCGQMVRLVAASHDDLGSYRAAARALQSTGPPVGMPSDARSALESMTAAVATGRDKAAITAELKRATHRRDMIRLRHYFLRLCRAR